MQVRRMLTVVAMSTVTSLALVTASAQAAPSQSLGPQGAPTKALVNKVKGAKVYYDYFDPYYLGKYEGYMLEPPYLVFPKTHEWGYELEPGAVYVYGNYKTTKVKVKEGKETVKYAYTDFYYNDTSYPEAYCYGYVDPVGWEDGSCYDEGELFGLWYAEKA